MQSIVTGTIAVSPERPFMWRSDSGCVYLRNVNDEDVIIAPRKWHDRIGIVNTHVTAKYAWARRLSPSEVVSLQNDV